MPASYRDPSKNILILENMKWGEEKRGRTQRWERVNKIVCASQKEGSGTEDAPSSSKQVYRGYFLSTYYYIYIWLCKLDLIGSSWQHVTDIAGAPCHIPLASDYTCSCSGQFYAGSGSPCSNRVQPQGHQSLCFCPLGAYSAQAIAEESTLLGTSFNQWGPCLPSSHWTILGGIPYTSQEVLHQRPL